MTYGPEVKHLVERIRDAGVRRRYLYAAIPDWWEAATENEPGAVDQLKIVLARRFGLDIRPLLDADRVVFLLPAAVRFKRSANAAELAPNNPVLAYCNVVARNIAAMMPDVSKHPDGDPVAAREEILDESHGKWVNLNALLFYCWKRLGIAIVALRSVPAGPKFFDAVTCNVDGKYVIFVAKNATFHAWASFILAHELGHIALGHVQTNHVLVDDPLLGQESSPDLGDDEEVSANQYALSLLGGHGLVAVTGDKGGSPVTLAESAMSAGKAERIDPGHLILRYARGSGDWATGQAALALLHRSAPDALSFVNERALEMLSFDELGDEARATVMSALSAP